MFQRIAVGSVAFLLLSGMIFSTTASAQRTKSRSSSKSNSPTLAQQLDNLGQQIIGAILPTNDKDQKDEPARNTTHRQTRSRQDSPQRPRTTRAGSILAPTEPSRTAATSPTPTPEVAEEAEVVPTAAAVVEERPVPAARPVSRISRPPREAAPVPGTARNTAARNTAARSVAGRQSAPTTPTASRPLHERLNSFRRSAFASKSSAANPAETADKPAPPTVMAKPPASRAPNTAPTVAVEKPVSNVPTVAAARGSSPRVAAGRDSNVESRGVRRSTPTASVHRVPVKVAVQPRQPATGGRPLIAPTVRRETHRQRIVVEAVPAVPSPALGANAQAAPSQSDREALLVQKSPVLNVQTAGPRRITVGKPSAYEVRITNSGEVAADEVVVTVNLPAWAEVVAANGTVGSAGANPTDNSQPLQWAVGRLDSGGSEKLTLSIIPRESRPVDLAVRWDYQPAASRMMIEVEEPKLALQIEGPQDVLYGQKEIFKIKLANTGNGDAESVHISLRSGGAEDSKAVSQSLGLLPAGQRRTIEVELTPRQAGDLVISVDVTADNGVHAEMAETVVVRRASLQTAMQGPAMQYVGAEVDYRMVVRNTGDAVAQNVKMSVALPHAVEYVSGVEGATLSAGGNELLWTLASLPPSGEQEFTVKCRLGSTGTKMLELVTVTDDGLSATANAATRVEAIADLALEVKDPGGPVAVGDRATYQLVIKNRGSKTAERVEVVTYFSNGIEPTAVEGSQHSITPGQVSFQPIVSVAPGQEVVLKIHATAEAPGNHVFRAEVRCKPLGSRLASEHTTHYYRHEPAVRQAMRP